IWRRIQVPETYTFWDLHCAITDAFGWLDYHLHEFTIAKPPRYRQSASTETVKIGIPGDEDWEKDVLPGRKTKIATYFSPPNLTAEYVYDFGDSWNHTVTLEGVQLKENGAAYPGCVGGERACPPEDCGGVPGYQRFLKAISFQNAKDHDELLQWAGGWFDPEWFDLSLIRFADPDLLWKIAFQDAPMSSIIRQTQYHRMKDGRRPA
ncbi:MAG: plasmid pRiA4b ORF-3 family protein, partial [bacterium]